MYEKTTWEKCWHCGKLGHGISEYRKLRKQKENEKGEKDKRNKKKDSFANNVKNKIPHADLLLTVEDIMFTINGETIFLFTKIK